MPVLGSEMHADRWFRFLRRESRPRVRLVCFPHAGGSASFFRAWTSDVPSGIELLAVRYPGREDRLVDPLADRMEELVAPLAASCAALRDAPLAFFGHSMGAAVAYEVALRLQRRHGTSLAALFVSGQAAPGLTSDPRPDELDDEKLLAELALMGGTDAEALRDPELRDLILPVIRADYRLVDRYAEHSSEEPVDAPLVAYYGADDAGLDESSIAAWARMTRSHFAVRALPGGHFYLRDQAGVLIRDILDRIDITGTGTGRPEPPGIPKRSTNS